jgi:hypothetical protein
VGGVSGRPTRENEEERSSHVPGSQRWKAPWSTGCRSPSRVAGEVWVLVGPSECSGLVPCSRSHRRQQVSSGRRRRGTSSACAKRTHSSRQAPKKRPTFTRTRPSLGPETRARQSALNSASRKWSGVSRSVRYRGRANLGNQEEPAPRSERTDECAARRVSPLQGVTLGGRA